MIVGMVNADGTATGLAPCTSEHVSLAHYEITCPTSVFGGAAIFPFYAMPGVAEIHTVVDGTSGTTVITVGLGLGGDHPFPIVLFAVGAHGIAEAG